MGRSSARRICAAFVLTAAVTGSGLTGCGTSGLPGTGVSILPFASIAWEQRPDLPNFTVTFDASGAVTDPSGVTSVNWVFGDGAGFVPGGLTIDHRYTTSGRFMVEAYIFDANGFVDTIETSINVTTPATASGPTPVNSATGVPITTLLQWTPGSNATSSVLYLSASLSDVQAGSDAARQGSFAQPIFSPLSLVGGTEYFWRVDTITSSRTVEGPVWSFRTANPPGPITNASPADGTANVALDVKLQWTAGTGASRRDVYFGTNSAAVAAAETTSAEFQGNQTATLFDPDGELANDTLYFWRVDEIGDGGRQRGAVLSFRTAVIPGPATNTSPADDATDVAVDAKLTWTAGPAATSHDVYFGTNRDSVENADHVSNLFRGNRATTEFTPALGPNIDYFWRIDEVGPGGTTKGAVHKFTTAKAPTVASEFSPEDNEIEIPVAPTLTWTAGQNAVDQLVFFGDDRNAVSAAGANDETGILRATLPIGTAQFEPGASDPLEENKEYFWRVDTRGPGGTARGPMLAFTTRNPILASNPSPADGAEDVALSAMLSWTAGAQGGPPLSHDVYLGTSRSGVESATTSTAGVFAGNFPAATLTFTPASLDMNTEYFWRIDERYDETNPDVDTPVAKGKVWSFTTVESVATKATSPLPSSGADDIDRNTDLAWTAGTGADSHDVYFGTNQTDVANATVSTAGIFKGNFPSPAFALPELANGTQYFWRIDSVNEAGKTTGDVWSFTTLGLPGQIGSPDPADGVIDQLVAAVLRWTAATDASTYDVYLGADQAAVTSADHGSVHFKGNQSALEYASSGLSAATTYYWRIDPVNSAGTTTGTVRSFTTGVLPGTASNPSPANNATNIAVSTMLSWTAGANALSYDVYFSTSLAAVSSAMRTDGQGAFRGNQSALTHDPGLLVADTQYFWRIDPVAAGGTTHGDVWRFRTALAPSRATLVAASGDGPADTAVGILLRPTLQWTPGAGPGTITHDVYFGTSQSAVTNATRVSPEFKQNQPGNTYQPGAVAALASATRHYWRIDEVDSLGGTTKGLVWQFDTTPATKFVILDPADQTAGTPTPVTLQAQDAAGNLVTDFQADVTLIASGGATGGGLIDITNGVGTAMIDSASPQTVTLTLTDSQSTGLNVASTQMVIFN